MFDLTGKTALVTGATGGIGGQIARALHAHGATVALSGTRIEELQILADELGSRAHVLPCNLSDKNAVEALVPAAEAAMGGIDILVNNAGITRDGLFVRMKDEDWDAVINVNLTATFRRYGRVISIGSVVGTAGNPGQANYAASKAGLIGLMKALAMEVATRNITANVVSPGFIESPMTVDLTDKQKENIMIDVPMGRLGSTTEIAAAVVYLASTEGGYVTGQTLHVNGGMVMI
jgi:3-oxoacyl-[acyl-carrier protein] reductase